MVSKGLNVSIERIAAYALILVKFSPVRESLTFTPVSLNVFSIWLGLSMVPLSSFLYW